MPTTLPVRDGRVSRDSMVWWLCDDGPVYLRASSHWPNIEAYPMFYQLKEPQRETASTN